MADLAVFLKVKELDQKVQDISDEIRREELGVRRRLPVQLPGVNLLQQCDSLTPIRWFLKKPRVTAAEFLALYAEFSNRALGIDDNPGKVVGRLYSADSEGRKLLSKFNAPDDWYSAGMLLMALAPEVGAELERVTDTSARMRLGPSLLSVSDLGVYSSKLRDTNYAEDSVYGTTPATVLPPVSSTDPAVRAVERVLYEHSKEHLAALTVIVLGIEEERVPRNYLSKFLAADLRAKGRAASLGDGKIGKVVSRAEAASKALAECEAVLESSSPNMLEELYAAAVPRLIGSKDFNRHIGIVSVSYGRHVKKSTRQRWMGLLRTHAGVEHAKP